jgi:hypothetical protein
MSLKAWVHGSKALSWDWMPLGFDRSLFIPQRGHG